MSTTAQLPSILIGGTSEIGCDLLGSLVQELSSYLCVKNTSILCHPEVWRHSGSDFVQKCAPQIVGDSAGDAGFLAWRKLAPATMQALYHARSDLEQFAGVRGGAELASDLFGPRMKISNRSGWCEATPDNLFGCEAFLDSENDHKVVLVAQDGASRLQELIEGGASPKAAAKIWVIESAIMVNIYERFEGSGRVMLLRIEDLLAEGTSALSSFVEFLGAGAGGADLRIGDHVPLAKLDELVDDQLSLGGKAEERHLHYLYGTRPEAGSLVPYVSGAGLPNGAELMANLGYRASAPSWDDVKLTKKEQRLRSPKAAGINPLAGFQKPQQATGEQGGKSNRGLFRWRRGDRQGEVPVEEIRPILGPVPSIGSYAPPQFGANFAPDGIEGPPDLAVVIAFHRRQEIIGPVIRRLLGARASGLKISLFLACSEDRDAEFAKALNQELGGVGTTLVPNRPLGAKWQAAIDFARGYSPGSVLITGSDDFVSESYLHRALSLLENQGPEGAFDFVVPASWFLYDLGGDSDFHGGLWELAYSSAIATPLGAGRVYSSRILDKFDWKLFAEEQNSGLDMFGARQVVAHEGRTIHIPSSDGVVLSVKGRWGVINSTGKLLTSESIQNRICEFEQVEFFREHFQTLPAEFRRAMGF